VELEQLKNEIKNKNTDKTIEVKEVNFDQYRSKPAGVEKHQPPGVATITDSLIEESALKDEKILTLECRL
jgi:hypothetical protein